MTRYLIIGGAAGAMIGSSAYFGLGRAWGAPVAVTGLAVLAVGFGLLSSHAQGGTRWLGFAVAISGSVLAITVVIRTSLSSVPISEGYLISGLFILFAASLALFGVNGLISGTTPGLASTALAIGAPLLAAGVWQERLGDIGFPVTVLGLVLLGMMIELAPGPG